VTSGLFLFFFIFVFFFCFFFYFIFFFCFFFFLCLFDLVLIGLLYKATTMVASIDYKSC